MFEYQGHTITPKMIARVTDHTFLKTEDQGVDPADQISAVEKLCLEAHEHGAFSVCVREKFVCLASQVLADLDSRVKVCSVIGFPRGDDYSIQEKVELLQQAREEGAEEFDMVIPYEALKRGEIDKVYDHVLALSNSARGYCLKVIFENCALTVFQKMTAYQAARRALIDSFGSEEDISKRFFKTSTGFGRPRPGVPVGATNADVVLMKKFARHYIGIKPAGGVSTLDEAFHMVLAAKPGMILEGDEVSINPYDFRIGASSLLGNLYKEGKDVKADARPSVQPGY